METVNSFQAGEPFNMADELILNEALIMKIHQTIRRDNAIFHQSGKKTGGLRLIVAND